MVGFSGVPGNRTVGRNKHGRPIAATGILCASVFLMMAGSAWASPTVLCMKNVGNGAVKGPTVPGGTTCEAGFDKISLPSAEELEVLNKVMPHLKYQRKGVGGKPTIQVEGVNVQVISGAGRTNAPANGTGNLVIGYDENPENLEQTGSHNLIIGERARFTSFGGIVTGVGNSITGEYSTVTGGANNTAEGRFDSVTGGGNNTAEGEFDAITGGDGNTAEGEWDSVTGGRGNRAAQEVSSVSGGVGNFAGAIGASVSGGGQNRAGGRDSSVSGGTLNNAGGSEASVSGGYGNTAAGAFASILGGNLLEANLEFEHLP